MVEPMSIRLASLVAAASAALSPWAASAAPGQGDAPSLTLYSGLGFQGRQVTFHAGAPRRVSPGFKARSAFSSGPWSLCDGAAPNSHCQTLNGAAARLKLEPRTVRLLAPAQAPPPSGGKPVAAVPPAAPPARAAAANLARARPIHAAAHPASPAGRRTRRSRARTDRLVLAYERDMKHRALAANAASRSEADQSLADGASPVAYSCRDGRSLTVLFDPVNATAEIRAGGEEPVVLARTESPTGFRYESWGRAFYGEGDQAAYQIGGAGRIDCWAERPYSQR